MYPDEFEEKSVELDGEASLPRVSDPADETDVMREQLEYLIEHISEHDMCGCPSCRRYLRARAILLEIFSDPEPDARPAPLVLPAAA